MDQHKDIINEQQLNLVGQCSSSDARPPKTRNFVVVFDIDNTLCKNIVSRENVEFASEYHPECPIIEWNGYSHLFLPHLQILFHYLLDKGGRIVFFSSAVEERNVSVIPELLTSFWGDEKYRALKSKGQFDIFSKAHTRNGIENTKEGNYVKDLRVVLRDGESLSDVILVEDDHSATASDQQPFLNIIDLFNWVLWDQGKDEDDLGFNYDFAMNSTYYMLGVFKTCLLYTSPSPRDRTRSRMPSSA